MEGLVILKIFLAVIILVVRIAILINKKAAEKQPQKKLPDVKQGNSEDFDKVCDNQKKIEEMSQENDESIWRE